MFDSRMTFSSDKLKEIEPSAAPLYPYCLRYSTPTNRTDQTAWSAILLNLWISGSVLKPIALRKSLA